MQQRKCQNQGWKCPDTYFAWFQLTGTPTSALGAVISDNDKEADAKKSQPEQKDKDQIDINDSTPAPLSLLAKSQRLWQRKRMTVLST